MLVFHSLPMLPAAMPAPTPIAESGVFLIFVLAVFRLLCPRLVVAVGLLIVAVLVVSIRVMVSMDVELP